ncbi:MAG: hypothetical protein QG578_1292 [Thermodesulfobacteriota bacterium]|nr:hypothetical protein [Thermodesulfobacteriota bacterium]
MAKNDFKNYICRPYCIFFKEGQKEEMTCRGAEVIEKLVLLGHINTAGLPVFEKEPGLWRKYANLLGKRVCATCSFMAEDCDFMSETPEAGSDADIEPCGGFILLALLMENGLIGMPALEKGL